jgi:membrane glycosyltransferase
MTPRPWDGWRVGLRTMGRDDLRGGRHSEPVWSALAQQRRGVLIGTIAAVTLLALGVQWVQVPPETMGAAALVRSALLALLFAWVAAGFATALAGFVALLRGDPSGPSVTADPAACRSAPTAVIMPICNEDVAAVFAGLRATCESLAATGRHGDFEVFVLSDTRDPALRAAELQAWATLRDIAARAGLPPVHYRWRRRRSGRKAGNVADFCRRWGRSFRYMIVLDADSVMTGTSLLQLVDLMERHPRVGIAQTAPRACGHASLHARAQQYAGRVLGRLFVHGLRWWQLGDSHYWGHNAILRVEPFMRHCALARLPGRGGLSGDILSHDFVEAALMRRAGWEVWLVPDIEGSYEQLPPHLLDELQRDRRWCQGNLQNARLIAEPGLLPVHRAMFATGVMAYASAPLWLAYVVLGLLSGAAPVEMTDPGELLLWALTGVMLFLPRVLAVVAVLLRGEQAAFGGRAALVTGAVMEALLASLQAPVRMLAHTLFVVSALLGLKLEWTSPQRSAQQVHWADAWQRLGPWALGALGLSWLAWFGSDVTAVARLALLTVPLLLAVPLVVWSSRVRPGEWLRRAGVWQVPEEARQPAVLQRALRLQQPAHQPRAVTPVAVLAVASRGWRALVAGVSLGLMAVLLGVPAASHDHPPAAPSISTSRLTEPASMALVRRVDLKLDLKAAAPRAVPAPARPSPARLRAAPDPS